MLALSSSDLRGSAKDRFWWAGKRAGCVDNVNRITVSAEGNCLLPLHMHVAGLALMTQCDSSVSNCFNSSMS